MGYQIYESLDLVTDIGMHKYQLLILGIDIIIITGKFTLRKLNFLSQT